MQVDAKVSATWHPLRYEGIRLRVLRDDASSGERAVLIEMQPGAQFPDHSHPGGEQLFVLEGTVLVGGKLLGTGEYLYTAVGDSHDVKTADGCRLFVTTPLPIVIRESARVA